MSKKSMVVKFGWIGCAVITFLSFALIMFFATASNWAADPDVGHRLANQAGIMIIPTVVFGFSAVGLFFVWYDWHEQWDRDEKGKKV